LPVFTGAAARKQSTVTRRNVTGRKRSACLPSSVPHRESGRSRTLRAQFPSASRRPHGLQSPHRAAARPPDAALAGSSVRIRAAGSCPRRKRTNTRRGLDQSSLPTVPTALGGARISKRAFGRDVRPRLTSVTASTGSPRPGTATISSPDVRSKPRSRRSSKDDQASALVNNYPKGASPILRGPARPPRISTGNGFCRRGRASSIPCPRRRTGLHPAPVRIWSTADVPAGFRIRVLGFGS